MVERKALSRRTRFEVFKRDGFRCVYCGCAPGEAELRVDHVFPVAEGGSNDPDNLATACHQCNAGKADKIIPRRIAAETIDKLTSELSTFVEIERGARQHRNEWLAHLTIPAESEAVLAWLSELADCVDCVDEEMLWHSPRLIEMLRGLQAVGLIEPFGSDRVVAMTPRGTTHIGLQIRSKAPRPDGTFPPPWEMSGWYAEAPFGRVEDIYG